eukprot:8542393-Pyramimonas_sp.AAC.1
MYSRVVVSLLLCTRAHRRKSCERHPSPASMSRPPAPGMSRNMEDTLRYLDGMAEPVPRNTSSGPPSRPSAASPTVPGWSSIGTAPLSRSLAASCGRVTQVSH